MFLLDPKITKHVDRLRTDPTAVARDARMLRIRITRAGNLNLINPEAFSDEWPEPIIANFINTAALDIAESLAPLPTLNCASGNMNSTAAKKKASLKTKIGANYWTESNLARFSVSGADWLFSYGFLPLVVEPNMEKSGPRIRFEDPYGAYPDIDRYGTVNSYAKTMRVAALTLASMFPEVSYSLLYDRNRHYRGDQQMEVVRFSDKDCTVMYCNDGRDTIPLAYAENMIARVPVAVAQRSSLDGEFRGQYDDGIWVQLARAKLAALALEAGVKAVEAPIAVPQDMVELPIGPDSIWRTDNPDKIRRVSLEIPNSAFQMDQRLEMEQMRSTRYPEARSGNISASVITGRGVEALMGSFDMQIKTAQDQFGEALSEATSIAFEMDCKAFGQMRKTIYGVSAGAPYKESYEPMAAIGEDYTCDVTYGFAAGLAPNNAVVMMLQLLGAGLVSKESVQKQLPFDVDPVQMGSAIAMERGRDAILEGVAALAQSIPAAAQMGQDPMMIVGQLATFLDKLRGGDDIEHAALAAFKPPEPAPGLQGDAALAADAAAAGGGLPPGMGPSGLMSNVAPGQAGMAPGGMPDLLSLAAGFRGGGPEMGATVLNKRAIA